MNHLSRLLKILTILKSKRLVTAPELAEKFDISVRTIYRDIRKLEDSGVPILTMEGKGYSIMDSYTMAPIMFTELEMNALITAQNLINGTKDSSLIQHFEESLVKIKSVIKSSLQVQGELLNSKLLVLKSKNDDGVSNSLTFLQMAITHLRVTELFYQAPNKEVTHRYVEPLAIFSLNNLWLMVTWCRLREDYRVFRLDRIENFKILEETFQDRNFDVREFFKSCEEFDYKP